MFEINLDITVVIKDCPPNGLSCLDFRRAFGLPDGTTNEVYLKGKFKDEKVCRVFSTYLDKNCNLSVTRSMLSNSTRFGRYNEDIAKTTEPICIEPEIISMFLLEKQPNPVPILLFILTEISKNVAKNISEGK